MSSNKLEIYTDGACLGNPGPGGWAALIIDNNQERILSGNNEMTTNNRMELLAVIKALESVNHHLEITIYTDSKYVINGITSWIKKWKTNDWKNSSKTPVKNIDLWKILDISSQKKKKKYMKKGLKKLFLFQKMIHLL